MFHASRRDSRAGQPEKRSATSVMPSSNRPRIGHPSLPLSNSFPQTRRSHDIRESRISPDRGESSIRRGGIREPGNPKSGRRLRLRRRRIAPGLVIPRCPCSTPSHKHGNPLTYVNHVYHLIVANFPCDAAMPGVTQALRDARDLPLVANRDNPKARGDFGYEVDDSPPGKRQSQTRVLNQRAFS